MATATEFPRWSVRKTYSYRTPDGETRTRWHLAKDGAWYRPYLSFAAAFRVMRLASGYREEEHG